MGVIGAASGFTRFALDPRLIAPVIYRDQPHQVTPAGLVITQAACRELRTFIQAHAGLMKAKSPYFWRIDIYPHPDRLVVLEVNGHFVDGWGTALNLSRSAGIEVDAASIGFPPHFVTVGSAGQDCLPELELLIQELRARGLKRHHLTHINYAMAKADPMYVYGRAFADDWPSNVWPLDGAFRDDKSHLARLSRSWMGRLVTTPDNYTVGDIPWDDVPQDVFLKFTRKDSILLHRAGFSVQYGKPRGKAPALRGWYNSGQLIAQAAVEPVVVDFDGLMQNAQLVVLTNGQVLTGYVQYSHRQVINDNSIHGPALFLG